MKVSPYLIEVLKNFSSINSGLVIKPGNTLKTISKSQAIFACATVIEDFPLECGIYDLNKVLGLLSLNKKDPEVVFEKDSLVYTGFGGSSKIRQRYYDQRLIVTPPNKELNFESAVNFVLTAEIHDWILEVASILSCPNIVIESGGHLDLKISAVDVKGEVVDNATVSILSKNDIEFKVVLKLENFNKIMSGEYRVDISPKGVCRFTHMSKNINYFIAFEKKESEFDV